MNDIQQQHNATKLQLYQAIAETTPDFLYAFDLNGRFIYANRRLLEVWGTTAEEAFGKSLHELGYPKWHADMHMRELRQVIETKKPIKGEVPFTGGSGISGIYEYIFNPMLGPEGRVEMIIGSTRDVSERKRAEADLRSSQQRWELAAEAMHLGLWAIELPSGELEESDSFVALLGLPRGVRHQSAEEWRKYVHPDDLAQAEAKAQAALTGKANQYQDEYRLIGADGVTRWVQVRGTIIRDADGKPLRLLGIVADITQRKADERAQAHLAAIVESSDDAIISKTLQGIMQSWNIGAQRIFGYTAEETIGRSVLMLLPPDRQQEEAAILARLRAGERIDHFESIRVTKDGRHIDVSLTISPMKDSSGQIIGASKIARDITRQKRGERELQAAKETAEEATRRMEELLESERAARAEVERASHIKDEFLATLSHELRTPLNAILGWAQILRSSPTPRDIEEGVQIIERNARVQTQIIEDLLDMSRIVSGKIRINVQRVDLSSVVDAAVETVRPAADAKGIRLQTVLDPAAGPVSGDPSRLQQVFWNLMTNAIKFTQRGGRVQVVLERVNSHLEVSVIDTGEGIAPEFLPYVFDRFRQADASTTRRHGGLGLGLAIVRQLVELHGGSVRVKSGGAGMGSTFIVSLPVSAIHPDPDGQAERRHPTISASAPMLSDMCTEIDGVKVLVVDDEPDAVALVKRVLEECNAVVITAATVREAMERLQDQRPDVLISDIGMPSEDGFSLIRKVRALGPQKGGNMPAVALTAYARAEDRMRAMLAGFDQHLVKPVEPAELITLVAVLSGRTRR